MLHSHPYSCTLLKPAEVSSKFLGSSIVLYHGTMVLANILGHPYGNKSEAEFQTIFETLDNRRLSANTSMTLSDDYAWYVGRKEQMIIQRSQIRVLAPELNWLGNPSPAWPGGVFLHPVHGLQQFLENQTTIPSLAIPMVEDSPDTEEFQAAESSKHCEITIAASPGTYGILHIDEIWQ